MIGGGFLDPQVSIFRRRSLTMLPAIAVIASGLESAHDPGAFASVFELGTALALVPLIRLTGRKDLMGDVVNNQRANWMAYPTVGSFSR